MSGRLTIATAAVVAFCGAGIWAQEPMSEVIQSSGGLPPHIIGGFGPGTECLSGRDEAVLILDRRDHALLIVDRSRDAARKIVAIGHEDGAVFMPTGAAVAMDGSVAVLDRPLQPDGRGPALSVPRVQVFSPAGVRLAGFVPPVQPVTQFVGGKPVLSPAGSPSNAPLGTGTIQHTGRSVLLGHPQTGRLITEYGLDGTTIRTIGALRRTGVERDVSLHSALNIGFPLVNPTGGFYYVFVTGQPMFRRYAQDGSLALERAIEGPEVDSMRDWPSAGRRVVTAAASPAGDLWVSLPSGLTYVYDAKGTKRRVLRLRGAGDLRPTSFSFLPSGRLLVSPGCYEFDARAAVGQARR